MSGSSIG